MSRIIEIDKELKELNRRKSDLLHERQRLLTLGLASENPEKARTWADRAFLIIRNTPGVSRDLIRKELGPLDVKPHISEQRLTNTLTLLRRSGLTENRGTRKRPKWYVKESEAGVQC